MRRRRNPFEFYVAIAATGPFAFGCYRDQYHLGYIGSYFLLLYNLYYRYWNRIRIEEPFHEKREENRLYQTVVV